MKRTLAVICAMIAVATASADTTTTKTIQFSGHSPSVVNVTFTSPLFMQVTLDIVHVTTPGCPKLDSCYLSLVAGAAATTITDISPDSTAPIPAAPVFPCEDLHVGFMLDGTDPSQMYAALVKGQLNLKDCHGGGTSSAKAKPKNLPPREKDYTAIVNHANDFYHLIPSEQYACNGDAVTVESYSIVPPSTTAVLTPSTDWQITPIEAPSGTNVLPTPPSTPVNTWTFSTTDMLPGVYLVSAKNAATGTEAIAAVYVISIRAIQWRRGTAAYQDVPSELLVRQRETIDFKAALNPPGIAFPAGSPLLIWGGTSGASGSGETKSITFNTASVTDSDYKTVTVACGNMVVANVLVCRYVLGAHSNRGAGAPYTDGHAWISISDFSPSPPTMTRKGCWPDDHPITVDNGPGTDIRTNLEPPGSAHQRFYLLKPSQKASLDAYVSIVREWKYTYTCASFASGSVKSAVGVDIDADDILGFETPREFGRHIDRLEASDPTSILNPESTPGGGGSLDSFDGSSFPGGSP